MPHDIFICYSHQDRPIAEQVAERFRASGWSVFMDVNTYVGRRWHKEIEQNLHAARAVVVLWSAASRDSDFVLEEAEYGKRKDILFPAFIETVEYPYGFARIQTADLTGWDGDEGHPELTKLMRGLLEHLGEGASVSPAGVEREAKAPPNSGTERPEAASPPARQNIGRPDSRAPGNRELKAPTEPREFSPEVAALLAELENPGTESPRRLAIGDELAELGDPRLGVGVDERGLPEIDWVEIPAGPFLFQGDRTIELPQYFLSRYPVTNAQYQSFIDAGGYREDRWWADLKRPEPEESRWSQSNRPRTGVDWYEATAFCRWLSAQRGVEIRLPTEREWERAAAGVEGRAYPWGKDYRSGLANVDEKENKDGPWYLGQTSAVGMYPHGASSEGVLDLSGNVWEWCANKHEEPDKVETDTSGDLRVLRGGSWFYSPVLARASFRLRYRPVTRGNPIGFRVLSSAPMV